MLSRTSLPGALLLALTLAGCSSGSISGPSVTPSAIITASPSSLSFTAAALTTSAAQTVSVANTGNASATLSGVTVTGTNSTAFAETTTCGTTLAAGATCTVSVTFSPTAVAVYSATVTVVTSVSTLTFPLTGTGTAIPAPVASLGTIAAFPATAAGTTSAAQTLTLSNTGTAALTVTGVALGGTNPTAFSQTNNCTSVAAGSSCTISITFTPVAAATTYNATLTVTDNTNGVAGSNQSVSLTGTGLGVAKAALSPTALTFSAALNTAATAQTVTLYNPGTATLTGIAVSLTGSTFSQTNTCAATLAVGATCTISVGFTTGTAGTYTGTLSVADSATGSPQTVALTGTSGVAGATFSATSIAFPATLVNTTSAASTVTLTNSGTATLTISSIALAGTNASNFATSNNCGMTLAAGAACTLSATFTPTATNSYAATITVTDSATGSPQTIALSGTGSNSTVSYQLYAFPEADLSVTPLYAFVNAATKSIDMTMYALQDTVFTADLVAACKRGVIVRVILDQNNEKSNNTTAYNSLNAQANCSAVWANKAFQVTHEKSIIVDLTQVAILSLNLQSQYYSTTRDYGLIENDAADVAAIEATFNADYAAGTTSAGVVGVSDYSYTPGGGDNNDLIWSPTTAQAAMLGIINNAKTSLLVENEEMSAANIVTALQNACTRGVTVHIAMVNDSTSSPYSSYATNFKALEASGCGVRTYPDTTTGLYIHAKAVIADYGLSTQMVYMGSINYSNASMTQNRELGLYISDPASILILYNTMTSDYAGATAF